MTTIELRFGMFLSQARRDPAEIRRSTWATSEAWRSLDAYLDYVRRHLVATEIIPELRAGRLLD